MPADLDKALDLMRDAGFQISVAEVAGQCGMSPFQLARLFAARMGLAPKAYMIRARLQQAAKVLAGHPRMAITDIAFDAGFESQQTFSRAFKQWSGVSPGRYRKESQMPDANKKLIDPAAVPLVIEAESKPRQMGPLRIAGFVVVDDGTPGNTPPDAWEKLNRKLPVDGQEMGYAVGVCWSAPESTAFTYMAGVVLQDRAAAPKGLEVRTVPAQSYAIFRQKVTAEPFGQQIRSGYAAIWGDRLPAMKLTPSGGPDFEVYPDDLEAGVTAGWLEYRIPVTA